MLVSEMFVILVAGGTEQAAKAALSPEVEFAFKLLAIIGAVLGGLATAVAFFIKRHWDNKDRESRAAHERELAALRAAHERELAAQQEKGNLNQKLVEADLVRQSKVIDAQAAFLAGVSAQLWRFRYRAMAVSYYHPDRNPDRYQEAVKSYDADSWSIFQSVRASISESRRLVSDNAYQKLDEFYKEKLVPFDQKVRQMIQSNEGQQDLNDYIFHNFTREIDAIIDFLTKELQLTELQLKSPPRSNL